MKFLLLYLGFAAALGFQSGATGKTPRASLLAGVAVIVAVGFLSQRVIG